MAGVVVAVLAIIAYVVGSQLLSAFSRPPSRVPPPNLIAGYEIDIATADGTFTAVTIGSDGSGCDRLIASERLYTACLVAINLDPRVIGASALGSLNSERTPALDALVWRARLGGDPAVCREGGLIGAFLAECKRLASADSYEVRDGALVARVRRPDE